MTGSGETFRGLKGKVTEVQAATLQRAHPTSVDTLLDRALREGARQHENPVPARGKGVLVRFPDVRLPEDTAGVFMSLQPDTRVLWLREALDDLADLHNKKLYIYSTPELPGTTYRLPTLSAGAGLSVSPAIWRKQDGGVRAGNVIGRPLYARRLPGDSEERQLFEVRDGWVLVSLTRAASLHAAAVDVHYGLDEKLDKDLLTQREQLRS